MSKLSKGIQDANGELYQFIPPIASENTAGGITAKTKTTESREVAIDSSTGRLYVNVADENKVSFDQVSDIPELTIPSQQWINEINATGQSVKNSIPADYTSLTNEVDDLKSDLSVKSGIYSEYTYENGSINWNDGQPTSDPNSMRTGMKYLAVGDKIIYQQGISANMHRYSEAGVQVDKFSLNYSDTETQIYTVSTSGYYRIKAYYKINENYFRNKEDGLAKLIAIIPNGYNIDATQFVDEVASVNRVVKLEQGGLDIDGSNRTLTDTIRFAKIEYLPKGTKLKNCGVYEKKMKVTSFVYDNHCEKIIDKFTVTLDKGEEYTLTESGYFRSYAFFTSSGESYAILEKSFSVVFDSSKSVKYDERKYSEYWENTINNKIRIINELQGKGAKIYSFVFATDLHIPQLSDNVAPLINKVMKECNIDALVNGGDFIWNSEDKSIPISRLKEMRDDFQDIIPKMLSVMGNHDDNSIYGTIDKTIYQSEIYNYLFRYLGNNVTFGPTGMYYFYDDVFTKTRIIILNCIDIPYTADAEGNLDYKGQNVYGFRQDQLSWFGNVALNTPDDGWKVVVIDHVPLGTASQIPNMGSHIVSNWWAIHNILNAYKNKTTFDKIENNGNIFDFEIHLDYSGTNKGGSVVACLAGHTHVDTYRVTNDIPSITTANGSTFYDTYSEYAPMKEEGTTTELAFDVFTINPVTRKVNVTRIGAGSDREFTY